MKSTSLATTLPVVYIMGSGRSGSTVLDTILGNHPDVLSVGELSNLHRFGWVNDEYCACGNRGTQCEFWNKVLRVWKSLDPTADVKQYIAMQSRHEVFRNFGCLQWARLGMEQTHRSEAFATYLRQTANLYAAMLQVSGKRVVVDSSKNPLRGAVLQHVPGLDVRYVHLVRDTRGVAWSRKKSFQKDEKNGVQKQLQSRSAWYSASYWTAVNLLADKVRSSRPSMLLRYEDLVAQPDEALADIGRLADLDLTSVSTALTLGQPMTVGHTIAGNRLRMAGAVKLRGDWEWMQKLTAREQRICWGVAGWLLKKYGYRQHVARPTELATAAAA